MSDTDRRASPYTVPVPRPYTGGDDDDDTGEIADPLGGDTDEFAPLADVDTRRTPRPGARRPLPAGHRGFRGLVLVVLVGAAVGTATAGPVRAATSGVVDRGTRFAAAVWRPLIHGDGWVSPPGDPSPSPSPSVLQSPAVLPQPASPAGQPKPTKTKR